MERRRKLPNSNEEDISNAIARKERGIKPAEEHEMICNAQENISQKKKKRMENKKAMTAAHAFVIYTRSEEER